MKWINCDYDRVELHFKDGNIASLKNLRHLKHPNDFAPEYKEDGTPKVYLIKDASFYKYVGSTIRPIHHELQEELNSNGNNLSKWGHLDKVEIIVWLLNGFDKMKMESVKSELVFQIRNKYAVWPECQNEINFNNNFPFLKKVGEALFQNIESKYPINSIYGYKAITENLFEEPYQYGLRGDPYLWIDLKVKFENIKLNSVQEFESFILNNFEKNTGGLPIRGKNYYVKHFSFGGMSSGSVSSDFWLDKGIPLLLKRYNKLKNYN